MSKLKYAMAGLGCISGRHIKAIENTGGEIIRTYDPDWSKNPTHKEFHHLLSSVADYIVICSPNKYHLEQVLQSVSAGKKVIVEKPPALSLFDLNEYSPDDDVNVVSQLRYMKDIQAWKRKLEINDDSEHIVRMNIKAHRHPITLANWRGHHSWSGGLMFIIGIHYCDVVTHLFGPLRYIEYASWYGDWKVQGRAYLENATVDFNLEITETEKDFKELIIDGQSINLAAGFYDLHTEVYKAIHRGEGIRPHDMTNAMRLLTAIDRFKNN